MTNLHDRYLKAKRALFEKAYSELNAEQRKAVFTVDGPLLILAGAGSGKTTVLVKRIAFIIKYGNAYDSLAPYATEEDIAELNRCLDENLPAPEWVGIDVVRPWEVLAITFTNKAARELKERLDAAIGNRQHTKD